MYNVREDLKRLQSEAVEICEILEIEPPLILVKDSEEVQLFKDNPTCKACVCVEVDDQKNEKIKAIYLRSEQSSQLSCLFFLAHELRHVYQHVAGVIFEQSCTERSSAKSVEMYNEQFIEIDANAFAVAFIYAEYGIEINLEEFKVSRDTLQKITQRKNVLLNEYWNFE